MDRFQAKTISLFTALAFSLSPLSTSFAASPAPVEGQHGMVVTAQHLATDVGVEVLKSGGNAVDAAVAVGYTLAVVYPTAGNIGGGGFMTIRTKDGKSTFLDFRERAPLAATKTMYLDAKGDIVPRASLDGYLAVGVPGSVMGFETAREKYGTKSRADLLAPAIAFAKDGFTFEQGDAASLAGSAKRLAKDEAAAKIFLKPDGKPYAEGEKLVQPELGAVLQAISEKGPDAFYKGTPADAIVKASQSKGGILAKEDFEQYSVRELKPIECNYRGYDIISSPRPPPAASSSARSSTFSKATRSPISATARPRRCMRWSRRCATPMSIATLHSAILTSSTIRSPSCSTRPMPPRSARRSIPTRPESRPI